MWKCLLTICLFLLVNSSCYAAEYHLEDVFGETVAQNAVTWNEFIQDISKINREDTYILQIATANFDHLVALRFMLEIEKSHNDEGQINQKAIDLIKLYIDQSILPDIEVSIKYCTDDSKNKSPLITNYMLQERELLRKTQVLLKDIFLKLP